MKTYQHYIDVRGEVLLNPRGTMTDVATSKYSGKPLYKKGHSQKDPKLGFTTNYRLMQVKSIAECSKGNILQYFYLNICH